ADIRGRAGKRFHVTVQAGKNPLAPAVVAYEDALYPPEHPVAPVAPFISDHELPDDLAVYLGHPVPTPARILEHRPDARVDQLRRKRASFGLHRHLHIELDDRSRVGGTRVANDEIPHLTSAPAPDSFRTQYKRSTG